MYFMALATDYDGTIAHDGVVREETVAALQSLKDTGRKLILVTGRELADLKRAFPATELFDKIVAENGALLYTPSSEEERTLAPPPSLEFIRRLKARGVEPISAGRSIVGTWEPHQSTVLEIIQKLGLELEIIFNKGAVMVLPTGVNKASGLAAALADLKLSPYNVVGVGDAENDHAFLKACGLSVAVDNAIPAVKETADLVTKSARGAGVEELVTNLTERDQELASDHGGIVIGYKKNDRPVELRPQDIVLIAGKSGLGKSSLAIALTERFVENKFQFCVLDPEGDFEGLEGAVTLGNADTPPQEAQVVDLLDKPENNVVVSALALKLEERPDFFAKIITALTRLRARTARPHWLIIDEAHHLLPTSRDSQSLALAKDLQGTIMVTVHPDAIAKDALASVTTVLAFGEEGNGIIKVFCKQAGIKRPDKVQKLTEKDVLFWRPQSDKPPQPIAAEKRRQSHKRHSRKYAEGELPEEASFYFRGPENKLKLRAQNLMIFLQIAEGVDDRTWLHHLESGDYSRWFRKQLKDKKLAKEAASIEENKSLSAQESRKLLSDAVRRRYTAPATASE
ncbi:HAD family hydrolase [Mesorhizobium sp. BAC0120]|uniref:HAD family hydrolase n=1 Tax=Mesorhizobium sp. BAC0120 TaxID=3090670 RepID=UPI00298C5358|nr:HAD family hydrolase [Mesorhizobium sp. BAC0120]MDW6021356.1 HAD family hydrolase [Mesorhizobium sp. BAC0120]